MGQRRRTEGQHGPSRPAECRHRLERVEANRDDQIGAAHQALLHAGEAEHAEHQRMRIRERALRPRRRHERRRQRFGERPQPLRRIVRSAVDSSEQQRARGVGEQLLRVERRDVVRQRCERIVDERIDSLADCIIEMR